MGQDENTRPNGHDWTPEFLTAEEVSAALRLPLSTVYHLAKTGVLPAIQLGRSWRFPSHEIAGLTGRPPASSRILVVDDDDVTRALVSGILTPRGHTVVEARDADEGLAAARRQKFQLLVIDFKLPGRDGTSLIHDLAGEYALSQILMITAFPDLAQMSKLFELGAVTLLRKPLDGGQLIEFVERNSAAARREKKAGGAEKTGNQDHDPEQLFTDSTQPL
jgi:excisionase family DNA binding protein